MSFDPADVPTQAQLEAAWQLLVALGVKRIADVSMAEWNRMLTGTGYSDTERRAARHLIVMRAELAKAAANAGAPEPGTEFTIERLAAEVGDLSRLNEDLRRKDEVNRREIARLDGALAKANQQISEWKTTYEMGRVGK